MEELEEGMPGKQEPEGPSVLPALAEVHRRAGRLEEAEQVARRGLEFEPGHSGARVVLALALLDQERPDDARKVLEPLAGDLLARHGLDRPRPGSEAGAWPREPSGVSEDEFEQAFAQARPEREKMVDADSIAERAIRSADLDLGSEPDAAPFATRTVAELLERQGDAEGARQIRATLESRREGAPGAAKPALGELERWLENLRRPRP